MKVLYYLSTPILIPSLQETVCCVFFQISIHAFTYKDRHEYLLVLKNYFQK